MGSVWGEQVVPMQLSSCRAYAQQPRPLCTRVRCASLQPTQPLQTSARILLPRSSSCALITPAYPALARTWISPGKTGPSAMQYRHLSATDYKCNQRSQLIENTVEPSGQSEILTSKHTSPIIQTQINRPEQELNQGYARQHVPRHYH